MKKIVFNGIEVNVTGCYPYRYPSGKEVLAISTASSTFEILKGLDGYTGTIQYFEDEVMKTEYNNYSTDFTCNYVDGTYSVELTRVGATEIKLQETNAALKVTSSALEELIFIVMEATS